MGSQEQKEAASQACARLNSGLTVNRTLRPEFKISLYGLSGGAVVIVVEINLTQMRYNSYNNHELDRKMNAKLIGLMELLEEKGTELREPYSAPLEDGIFELRCKLGSNITRALYFFYVGKRIVVTNGFVKKTQKTPPGEIKIAKDRRKDWIERQERENKNAGKNGRR